MRGRTSKLMLGAGFVAVLALVIGLAQLTRGASQMTAAPPRPPGPEVPSEVKVAEAPPAAIAPQSAAREYHPIATAPRAQVAPVKQPELASPPVSFRRELKRDANGKLVPIIPVKDLREQLPLADAPMKACIERSGQLPTGKATLNFTVGAKNNKAVIETTGVQDEETLAAYPEILACMHQTANLLLPEGRPVPELGTGIYVRRHVRIENGMLVEDSLFDFSYNP